MASGMMLSVGTGFAAQEKLYDAAGKRDPFVPPYASSAGVTAGLVSVETIDELVVEGIIYDPKNGSFTVLNGSLLKQGELSGNVKVLDIQPDKVFVSVNGVEGHRALSGSEAQKE